MEILHGSIFICTLTLLFALLIERLLELIKSILDFFDSRFDWHRFWSWRAERIAQRLERRLKMNNRESIKFYAFIIEKASAVLVNKEASKKIGVPTISGDAVRAIYIKLFIKLLGISFGLAFALGLQLDIVTNWDNITSTAAKYKTNWYGLLITGFGMGLGSAPIHKLITTLEHFEKTRPAKQEKPS